MNYYFNESKEKPLKLIFASLAELLKYKYRDIFKENEESRTFNYAKGTYTVQQLESSTFQTNTYELNSDNKWRPEQVPIYTTKKQKTSKIRPPAKLAKNTTLRNKEPQMTIINIMDDAFQDLVIEGIIDATTEDSFMQYVEEKTPGSIELYGNIIKQYFKPKYELWCEIRELIEEYKQEEELGGAIATISSICAYLREKRPNDTTTNYKKFRRIFKYEFQPITPVASPVVSPVVSPNISSPIVSPNISSPVASPVASSSSSSSDNKLYEF